MSDNQGATYDRDDLLENLAAELNHDVYPIALRIGMRGSWLDLELEHWHVLADAVRMWERELRRCR
jgi:hypothetical protein